MLCCKPITQVFFLQFEIILWPSWAVDSRTKTLIRTGQSSYSKKELFWAKRSRRSFGQSIHIDYASLAYSSFILISMSTLICQINELPCLYTIQTWRKRIKCRHIKQYIRLCYISETWVICYRHDSDDKKLTTRSMKYSLIIAKVTVKLMK